MWSQGVNVKIFLEILRFQGSPDLGGLTIILSLGISDVCESTWQKMESKFETEFIRMFQLWEHVALYQEFPISKWETGGSDLHACCAVGCPTRGRDSREKPSSSCLLPSTSQRMRLYTQHTSTPTHVLVSLGRQRISFCSIRKECEVTQSCPTLCDPVDCSPPGSSVHGILQARILEWVAISFSLGSSQPRDRT